MSFHANVSLAIQSSSPSLGNSTATYAVRAAVSIGFGTPTQRPLIQVAVSSSELQQPFESSAMGIHTEIVGSRSRSRPFVVPGEGKFTIGVAPQASRRGHRGTSIGNAQVALRCTHQNCKARCTIRLKEHANLKYLCPVCRREVTRALKARSIKPPASSELPLSTTPRSDTSRPVFIFCDTSKPSPHPISFRSTTLLTFGAAKLPASAVSPAMLTMASVRTVVPPKAFRSSIAACGAGTTSGFGAPTSSPSGFGAPTPTFGTPAPTVFGNTPSPAFGLRRLGSVLLCKALVAASQWAPPHRLQRAVAS